MNTSACIVLLGLTIGILAKPAEAPSDKVVGFAFEYASQKEALDIDEYATANLEQLIQGKPARSGVAFEGSPIKTRFGVIMCLRSKNTQLPGLDWMVQIDGFEGTPSALIAELARAGAPVKNTDARMIHLGRPISDNRTRMTVEHFRGTVRELLTKAIPALTISTPRFGPFIWYAELSHDKERTVVRFGDWPPNVPTVGIQIQAEKAVRVGAIKVVPDKPIVPGR